MSNFVEGMVVICGSQQAGTVISAVDGEIAVITRNGDVWHGPAHQVREPSSQEELDACPIEVEHVEPKVKIVRDRD